MEIFNDLFGQLEHAPIALVLLLCLNFLGLGLKYIAIFPNRFIPAMVVAAGAVAYMFLGDCGAISPEQHHPMFVLALYGFLIGCVAWVLHNRLLYKFEPWLDKHFPMPKEGNKTESDIQK